MIGMLKNLLHLKKPKTTQKSIDERISDLYDSLQVDVLAVAFGDDILPYAQNIVNGIGKFRIKLKDQSGFIIPPIRVINDKSLQENEIHILVMSCYSFIFSKGTTKKATTKYQHRGIRSRKTLLSLR